MLVQVEEFLKREGVIFDIRSPCEYTQGHIPSAVNLPLFSDEERSAVGKAYKFQGENAAFEIGLEIASPKIPYFIDEVSRHIEGSGIAKVHCWRGGMRSSAFEDLLCFIGLEPITLNGGYRAYRRWCRNIFNKEFNYRLIGGLTGTGKTKILFELRKLNEQIIDLEDLAAHPGSAFGTIAAKKQPTTEQFHNEIAWQLSQFDLKKPVWIEDESRMIGACHLPEELFIEMQKAPLYFIKKPLEERLENINRDYGHGKPEMFIECVKKIRRKLGNEKVEEITKKIACGKLKDAAKQVLLYYDAAYNFHNTLRNQQIIEVAASNLKDSDCALTLISLG